MLWLRLGANHIPYSGYVLAGMFNSKNFMESAALAE